CWRSFSVIDLLSWVLLFSFSSYCSDPPRTLHSFPTRRSSDLSGQADANLVERRVFSERDGRHDHAWRADAALGATVFHERALQRSEEHTSELQSLAYLVCRLLLEKKKKDAVTTTQHPPVIILR